MASRDSGRTGGDMAEGGSRDVEFTGGDEGSRVRDGRRESYRAPEKTPLLRW